MWRPEQRAPAAIAVVLIALAVALVVVIGLKSLGNNSTAATSTAGPKPSRAQQHAAGVLSAFVYERGTWYEGGNVKACQPNWRPVANVVAQLKCTAFGQPSVYTRFKSASQADAYFKHLASQGHPASGSWGACQRHIPSANWSRTILGDNKESGQVAFRQSGGNASVVWIWPNMHTVAQTTGRLSQRPAICRAWDLNA
jgi:hypothetical protein